MMFRREVRLWIGTISLKNVAQNAIIGYGALSGPIKTPKKKSRRIMAFVVALSKTTSGIIFLLPMIAVSILKCMMLEESCNL